MAHNNNFGSENSTGKLRYRPMGADVHVYCSDYMTRRASFTNMINLNPSGDK